MLYIYIHIYIYTYNKLYYRPMDLSTVLYILHICICMQGKVQMTYICTLLIFCKHTNSNHAYVSYYIHSIPCMTLYLYVHSRQFIVTCWKDTKKWEFLVLYNNVAIKYSNNGSCTSAHIP